MTKLDFYFDIYSPYAYLAFHRLLKIAGEHDCEIRYHPVDLKLLKVSAGNTGPANIEIPPKIKYLMTDLKRWADRYGLPFGSIPKGKSHERINKGVFFADREGQVEGYIRAAYALVWGRGGDADDDGELSAIAESMGWDAAAFLAWVGSTEADGLFRDTNDRAVAGGVFGVPIVIGDGEMWWGNDRLDFLQEHLAGLAS